MVLAVVDRGRSPHPHPVAVYLMGLSLDSGAPRGLPSELSPGSLRAAEATDASLAGGSSTTLTRAPSGRGWRRASHRRRPIGSFPPCAAAIRTQPSNSSRRIAAGEFSEEQLADSRTKIHQAVDRIEARLDGRQWLMGDFSIADLESFAWLAGMPALLPDGVCRPPAHQRLAGARGVAARGRPGAVAGAHCRAGGQLERRSGDQPLGLNASSRKSHGIRSTRQRRHPG